jgi:hypothetical protein
MMRKAATRLLSLRGMGNEAAERQSDLGAAAMVSTCRPQGDAEAAAFYAVLEVITSGSTGMAGASFASSRHQTP